MIDHAKRISDLRNRKQGEKGMFNVLDRVRNKESFTIRSGEVIPAGEEGTIVYQYERMPKLVEVEFASASLPVAMSIDRLEKVDSK